MKYKNSIFFLGMAVAYGVLFVVQMANKDLLPIQVYFFVAWASLQLSILELVKTATVYTVKFHRMKKKVEKVCDSKKTKNIRVDKLVIKITDMITYLQYIIILIMAILTPLKDIPNNAAVNKQISCLTLLSFAVIFLNLFFNQYGSETYAELRDKMKRIG